MIDFLVARAQQVRALARYSEPSVLAAAYEARDVRDRVPFAAELSRAIRQGRPRPVSSAYEKISEAISANVRRALGEPDQVSPEQALHDADEQIERAIYSLASP